MSIHIHGVGGHTEWVFISNSRSEARISVEKQNELLEQGRNDQTTMVEVKVMMYYDLNFYDLYNKNAARVQQRIEQVS